MNTLDTASLWTLPISEIHKSISDFSNVFTICRVSKTLLLNLSNLLTTNLLPLER